MYSLKLRVRENEAISRSNAHDLGIGEDSLSATTNSETIKQSDERKLKTSVCQGKKKTTWKYVLREETGRKHLQQNSQNRISSFNIESAFQLRDTGALDKGYTEAFTNEQTKMVRKTSKILIQTVQFKSVRKGLVTQ